jgi:hypothetical protein
MTFRIPKRRIPKRRMLLIRCPVQLPPNLPHPLALLFLPQFSDHLGHILVRHIRNKICDARIHGALLSARDTLRVQRATVEAN